MAKQIGRVYLGYEDEAVNDENNTLLSYNVNKIGGFPDWPTLDSIESPPKCQFCGLHRLLVVQCYAPLENSKYHRILYVFACISPNCWVQSESWLCVRIQIEATNTSNCDTIKVALATPELNLTWCNGADEWDENDNGDSANGNYMSVDNALNQNNTQSRFSDEDEESNSVEIETVEQALGNLNVKDAHNANMSPGQGAVGAIGGPVAAAELEGGDEPGLVTVDTPTELGNDLDALLHQTAELPQDLRRRLVCGSLQFAPKFIYVEEELRRPSTNFADDKVTELLNKYRKENEIESMAVGDKGNGGGNGGDDEVYEETAPLHGDRLFHNFVTRLRDDPGQILRYSREEPPILGAVLPDQPPVPTVCARCDSRLICELQLLPAFANTLQVLPVQVTHLHFLSVLVFTCVQSCWQPGDSVVHETIVFQPEV